MRCPRCAATASAYSRCDRCGLVLGFEGLTVIIDFDNSPQFRRTRAQAQRQPSYTEWTQENGRRFLRVTYSLSELERFGELAMLAASLPRKKAYLNGLEIGWPEAVDTRRLHAEIGARLRPQPQRSAELRS